MAVISRTFGSVTLTGEDAKKFKNQVTYGKPSQIAKDNVAKGVALARQFRDNGRTIKIKIPT